MNKITIGAFLSLVIMATAFVSVSPSVGYFGPVTKIAMYSNFASHGWLNLLGWAN